MNPVQQARALIAQGFRVVPTDGKAATVEGFKKENTDFTCGPEHFGEPKTRVGVLCGPCPAVAPDRLICIDLDGHFEDSEVICAFLDLLPLHTLESHGDRHLFFRVPPSESADLLQQWNDVFRTKASCGGAVDLKWEGGYACEAWDWAPGTPVDALASGIAPFPLEAIEFILEAREAQRATKAVPAKVGDPIGGPDALRRAGFDPAVVRQDASEWLQRAPEILPSADRDGGSAMLLAAGGLLVGFGLDECTAEELLCDVYCPHVWPDEDPNEQQVSHKIDEIETKGSEVWQPLQLAHLARNLRDGAALTMPDTVADAIKALPAGTSDIDMAELQERFLTWNSRLARTAKGDVKSGAGNLHVTLEFHPKWTELFAYDDFAKEVVYTRTPIELCIPGAVAGGPFDEDNHVFTMQSWLSAIGVDVQPGLVIAAVHTQARARTFHPVRDWLARLPVWDGVDRNLAGYLGSEQTPYHRAVCAKWLRSAVARAMVPGCKADTMLILEGKQGARKSTAIRCLCPNTNWFYEAASRKVGDTDFMQDMRGKWLCEIPEVDQLIRSRDESELKAFLSRTADRYRASYGRRSHDFARQLVSAGTTNHESYLRDETGNRRYWPVKCGAVGPILDGKICDDRDQLWAQAFAEYNAGEPWWLTSEEDVFASDEQTERLEEDPWTAHLQGWVDTRAGEPFTTVEALSSLEGAKPLADQTDRDINLMAKALRKMGLVLGPQRRVGGHRVRYWEVPAK